MSTPKPTTARWTCIKLKYMKTKWCCSRSQYWTRYIYIYTHTHTYIFIYNLIPIYSEIQPNQNTEFRVTTTRTTTPRPGGSGMRKTVQISVSFKRFSDDDQQNFVTSLSNAAGKSFGKSDLKYTNRPIVRADSSVWIEDFCRGKLRRGQDRDDRFWPEGGWGCRSGSRDRVKRARPSTIKRLYKLGPGQ